MSEEMKLLGCPFCGDPLFASHGHSEHKPTCYFRVAAYTDATLEDLNAAWNRRVPVSVEMEAALQKAIDLISIPAAEHGREERDAAAGITGGPRYSAWLRRLHAECAALLPVLKAAVGEKP